MIIKFICKKKTCATRIYDIITIPTTVGGIK